ncbi:hypothetical protein QP904_04740 [Corynebacterium kefirresidentii]|uniref:hypothetical protein n=1 Tax=Corynebacterium sp. MSK185 TaxID=3377092 RepID=UPI00254E49E2|nr:hypothetical protein [Corynebacterium kefirresidentii]MDK8585779.1 hypothetical protein [Corynebacterium kefirresidentii]
MAGPLYGPAQIVLITVGEAEQEKLRSFIEGDPDYTIRYYPPPLPFDFQATLEPQGGRYVTTRLDIRQRPGSPPLQQAELVQVPLSRLQSMITGYIVYEGQAALPLLPAWYEAIKNDHETHLKELGTAYRLLRIQGTTPTTVLAKELGVSKPTVRRWLQSAVAAGHLTEDERVR